MTPGAGVARACARFRGVFYWPSWLDDDGFRRAQTQLDGHLTALRRTVVGPFGLTVAKTLERLAEQPEVSLDLDHAVAAAFPRRDVDHELARALTFGKRLPAGGIAGTYGVFDPDGRAVALATDDGPIARPLVVLTPA